MITVAEKGPDGRRGDAFNREVDYVVIGTDTDEDMTEAQAIQAVVDVTDEDIDGILRANAVIREWFVIQGRTIAIITMQYGEASGGGGGILLPESEAVYEFAYQAPSEHVYFSLETIQSYGTNAPNFGRRIKVDPENGRAEGLTLPAGNTTNIWRINTNAAFVDSAYEALVESMMGAVNSTIHRGRPIGTMRFVQCDSQVTSGNKLSMTWGFQFSANVTGLSFQRADGAHITGVDKKGHELIWTYDEEKPDATTGKLVPQTKWVYVERVFPLADFSALGF